MQHHEDDEDFQILPTQRMPLDEPNHFDNTPGDGDLLPSDPDSESDDSEGGSNNCYSHKPLDYAPAHSPILD